MLPETPEGARTESVVLKAEKQLNQSLIRVSEFGLLSAFGDSAFGFYPLAYFA